MRLYTDQKMKYKITTFLTDSHIGACAYMRGKRGNIRTDNFRAFVRTWAKISRIEFSKVLDSGVKLDTRKNVPFGFSSKDFDKGKSLKDVHK